GDLFSSSPVWSDLSVARRLAQLDHATRVPGADNAFCRSPQVNDCEGFQVGRSRERNWHTDAGNRNYYTVKFPGCKNAGDFRSANRRLRGVGVRIDRGAGFFVAKCSAPVSQNASPQSDYRIRRTRTSMTFVCVSPVRISPPTASKSG